MTTTAAPIEHLLSAAAAASAGLPLPPAAATWIVESASAYLAGGAALDVALGLAGGPGHRKPRTLWRLSERNRHLIEAHALFDGSPWSRSVSLAAEIRRFEAIIYPRWRQLAEPPAGASALRSCLFHARCLAPLPFSARALHDLCTERPVF